jgi:hypothetical protein
MGCGLKLGIFPLVMGPEKLKRTLPGGGVGVGDTFGLGDGVGVGDIFGLGDGVGVGDGADFKHE